MPLTPEDHAKRALGVGASESAAVLGLSRYATALDIFRRKRGIVSSDYVGNEMMTVGLDIEQAICNRYERETGLRGQHFPRTMQSERYPWMMASLDWLGDDRVTDFKLSGSGEYGEPGTDEVPQEVLVQVTHQMIVADRDRGQVGAFILVPRGHGKAIIEFRVYDIPFNRELGDAIIEGTREFWQRVERDDPPPPASLADEVKLYQFSSDRMVTADEHAIAHVARLREVDEALKVLAQERENLANEIKVFMKDADTLLGPNGALATWRTSKPAVKYDLAALRERYPRAVEKFRFEQPGSRRFLLKDGK